MSQAAAAAQKRVSRVITLLGSPSVGKSTLCTCFTGGAFSHEYEPTIRNLFQRNITVNTIDYELQIHDTAGLERHAQINGQYINSDGFILVYSTTDYQSFEIVNDIFNSLADELNRAIPLVLIGNKADLEENRKVKTEMGQALAKQWNAAFYETSALDGRNVLNSFVALLNLIDPSNQAGLNPSALKVDKQAVTTTTTTHPNYHSHKNGLTTTNSAANKGSCVVS